MLLIYPVEDTTISQEFGFNNEKHPERSNFYNLFDKKHSGIDFPVNVGTNVFASFDGIVVRNEKHKGMGNVVGVRNGNIVALYAHLSKSLVELGQIVKQREIIAISGNTGDATTEPHLHFELRDITKDILKNMVFEPKFGENIPNYKKEFIYNVNNTNTKKTLLSLSELYFGNSGYVDLLKFSNSNLKYGPEEILPEKTKVVIPNYR